MIRTREIRPGVVEVTIPTAEYGQAGQHWRSTLSGPVHGGFGRIWIQRFGARERRYDSCWELRGDFRGNPGVNLDECPGAMFVWELNEKADIEPIDAIDNQALGRDLKNALRGFPQPSPQDLWEVVFRFV